MEGERKHPTKQDIIKVLRDKLFIGDDNSTPNGINSHWEIKNTPVLSCHGDYHNETLVNYPIKSDDAESLYLITRGLRVMEIYSVVIFENLLETIQSDGFAVCQRYVELRVLLNENTRLKIPMMNLSNALLYKISRVRRCFQDASNAIDTGNMFVVKCKLRGAVRRLDLESYIRVEKIETCFWDTKLLLNTRREIKTYFEYFKKLMMIAVIVLELFERIQFA